MKTFAEMQDDFYAQVREELLSGTDDLTDRQLAKFRRTFSPDDPDKRLPVIISDIPRKSLARAMDIIERALARAQ